MRAFARVAATIVTFSLARGAVADPVVDASPPELRPAFELNVLWPLFGISELKGVVPLWGDRQVHGDLIVGAYLDYAHWLVRSSDGPTALVSALTGYRQFFGYGFHVEATLGTGWRHEEDAPNNMGTATYNDFYMRLWLAAGWQYDRARFYVNARPRLGVLIDRDPHYSLEKKLVPVGDVNVGFRF
jgi:hypothetical protein